METLGDDVIATGGTCTRAVCSSCVDRRRRISRVRGDCRGCGLFVAECFSGRLRIGVKCILGCLGRFVCLLNSGDSWYFIVCDDFFCIRSRLFSDITVIKGL